jgi:hypothetical protein
MVSGFTTDKAWPSTSGTRLTLHWPMIAPWPCISRGTEWFLPKICPGDRLEVEIVQPDGGPTHLDAQSAAPCGNSSQHRVES